MRVSGETGCDRDASDPPFAHVEVEESLAPDTTKFKSAMLGGLARREEGGIGCGISSAQGSLTGLTRRVPTESHVSFYREDGDVNYVWRCDASHMQIFWDASQTGGDLDKSKHCWGGRMWRCQHLA